MLAKTPNPRVRAIPLNKIPGYHDALHRAQREEFKTRECNWFGLVGSIAGCKVRVMTVRDYVALMHSQSPFIVKTEPTFEHLGEFLWYLSPEIERWHNRIGWRKSWIVGCRWSLFSIERWQIRMFSKRLRRRLGITKLENAARAFQRANPGQTFPLPDDCAFVKAMVAAFEYVERMFIDRPAGIAKNGADSGLLYLTSWFDAIQSEYKKTDEEVWRMPLPQLFARLKAMHQRHNPSEPDFNARQDALKAQIIRSGLNLEELLKGKLSLDSKPSTLN